MGELWGPACAPVETGQGVPSSFWIINIYFLSFEAAGGREPLTGPPPLPRQGSRLGGRRPWLWAELSPPPGDVLLLLYGALSASRACSQGISHSLWANLSFGTCSIEFVLSSVPTGLSPAMQPGGGWGGGHVGVRPPVAQSLEKLTVPSPQ